MPNLLPRGFPERERIVSFLSFTQQAQVWLAYRQAVLISRISHLTYATLLVRHQGIFWLALTVLRLRLALWLLKPRKHDSWEPLIVPDSTSTNITPTT